MAADNQVEIRFKIVDEKTTPAAATPAASTPVVPSDLNPSAYSQKEKDAEKKLQRVQEESSRFERFEHRLEHKMKHLGARLIASSAIEEIGGALGLENTFVSRLGEHAIEGAMMGGPVGAALKSLQAVVHEVISQIKSNSEEVKRLRLESIQREEKAADAFLDFKFETNAKVREAEEQARAQAEREAERLRDYMQNAVRYITVPYTGRG